MQDCWVGDIGDFSNNGLLRHLFGGPGAPPVDHSLRLGVVWYRNQGGTAGKKTFEYLNYEGNKRDWFRDCDPSLYGKLEYLVTSGSPTVESVCKAEILPGDTLHYKCSLVGRIRREWFQEARKKMAKADVVFLNPDKGIASGSGSTDSIEHISLDEIRCFYNHGKSLIIYQHNTQRPRQIEAVSERLQTELRLPHKPIVLWWHRTIARFYFIVPQPGSHRHYFDDRVQAFKKTKWCHKWPGWDNPHFTVPQ